MLQRCRDFWVSFCFAKREGAGLHDDRAQLGNAVAEVAVPRQMFREILSLIIRLRAPPAPA